MEFLITWKHMTALIIPLQGITALFRAENVDPV